MAAFAPFEGQSPGQPSVSGFLHRTGTGASDVLVLTHGAGGNCRAPLLIALAEAFAAEGISVLRCDLLFRQRRPYGPPAGTFAEDDQAGLRRAAELVKAECKGRVFLGGASYGGRIASMLMASDPGAADALLLLSYPLHPPGKPQQLRTKHLAGIQAPTLFISGTKDPFGTIAELDAARRLLPAHTELVAIEGAGHSLLTKTNKGELVSAVVQNFLRLVAGR